MDRTLFAYEFAYECGYVRLTLEDNLHTTR